MYKKKHIRILLKAVKNEKFYKFEILVINIVKIKTKNNI